MKTVHKIIDLCEELSDLRVNFNVDINHFHLGGQSLLLGLIQWTDDMSEITQHAHIADNDPDGMLELLELVKYHGFRGES
jgi:sugar phosphate isomerase/epimerase